MPGPFKEHLHKLWSHAGATREESAGAGGRVGAGGRAGASGKRDADDKLALNLTKYYLRTLKEADLKTPDFKDRRTGSASQSFVKAPLRGAEGEPSIEAGCLSPDDTKKLYGVCGERGGHGKGHGKGIGVLVSLATLNDVSASHGALTSLLVLPATLNRDGSLEPNANNLPWINIERMHRVGIPDEPIMVGGEDALRRYWGFVDLAGKDREADIKAWEDVLAYARAMFEHVTSVDLEAWAAAKNDEMGQGPAASAEDGMQGEVITDTCYVVQEERVSASARIQELYRSLSESSGAKPLPKLYRNLLVPPARERELGRERLSGFIAGRFTGTMSDVFPLTETQRIAVRGFFSDKDGDVTAVSGPPGTGKTTMLQAVVASTIVNHALRKADPPVIIATSTNNQAVTNIIKSFASVSKDDPAVLEHRWIMEAPETLDPPMTLDRELTSLAVYCPSGAKEREAREGGYLLERCRGKTGAFSAYSDPDYMDAASERFLRFAGEALGRGFSSAKEVAEGVGGLLALVSHDCDQLVDCFSQLARGGSQADGREALGYVGRLRGCGALGATEERSQANVNRFTQLIRSMPAPNPCAAIDELDALLDVTVRYTQFWLAVHYYEAQWMACGEDNSFLAGAERGANSPAAMGKYWRQAAALTPCFVMTEYQIPSWMSLYEKGKGRHFDFGRADLLIVDEAGQVDTCVGAAAFALAKRAIVVGDEHQLSPIWSMEPKTDEFRAKSMGLEAEWETMGRHGLTCSQPSSVMRAASYAGRWCYGPTKDGARPAGLFLAEHFRCHPLIINYCNELIYGGLLRPRRPMPSAVIEGLRERADGGSPLDGSPEKSSVSDARDDGGRYKAYRLLEDVPNPLLFVPVRGSSSQPAGSSRKNPAEATAIAAWVAANGTRLSDIYGRGVGETIAVVTPFAAQARCISRELAKAIGRRRAGSITVGTAHRLQGAERPVVLFSPVYGDNDEGATFIDATPELMNVAVSRAKDLFIVFGAMRRWKDRGTTFHLIHRLADMSDGHFAPTPGQDDATDAPTRTQGQATQAMPQEAESDRAQGGACGRGGLRARRDTYLYVPFDDKDEAKALGARWDGSERLWFAPAGADLPSFARWPICLDVPFEQKDEAKAAGARWDGKRRRWHTTGGADLSRFARWL